MQNVAVGMWQAYKWNNFWGHSTNCSWIGHILATKMKEFFLYKAINEQKCWSQDDDDLVDNDDDDYHDVDDNINAF